MEIEFIARYPKEFSKEEQEDIDAQAKALMLCNGELSINEARKKVTEDDEAWQYGPWVLEMDDISDFNMVDKEHTRVIKKNGMSLVFKINYEYFKGIKLMSTGKLALNYLQFPAPMQPIPIKRSKKQ